MRGVYGKARARYIETSVGAGADSPPFVESSVTRTVDPASVPSPAPELRASVWEFAKVGAVLTLSVIAVVTAGKVLSPTWARR